MVYIIINKTRVLQLLKTIKRLFVKRLIEIKLIRFQILWRHNNPNNYTDAECIFPMNCVTVGYKSYGGLNVYSYSNGKDEKLQIGNFVSIANNVSFILGGNHNIDTVTSYPLKSFILNDYFKDSFSKGPIVIEDEVWIGFGVTITSGVRIGKGAIIATRSVVVKDVPPYSIYGGNPAKLIKYRFDEVLIAKLLQVDLQSFSKEFIANNIDCFYTKIDATTDLDFFLTKDTR